jgi:hypothetical protein
MCFYGKAWYIIGDGFRILKRSFWWIILKVVDVAMNFLVGKVHLKETGI